MADDAAYKEAKLDFDKEAWLDSQEPCMRKRFEEMFTTQEKVDDHLKDLTRERQELERKYINLCEPLLQERNAIVRGDKVPEGSESEAKGIPGFWATVFKNHEAFEDMLNNKDEEVLKLLSDVRVERFQTEKGGKLRWAVKIIFAFAENEYFEEKELTKTFFYEDQRENIGAETEGCNITWKPGKDPTKKYLKKKDGKGGYIRKTKEQPSVFSFFSELSVPDVDEIDQEQIDELEEAVEMDFAMGSAIADDIVPQAFKYYTGQAQAEMSEDEDDGDCSPGASDDDDDANDDDDDDDGDDDDDDDSNNVSTPPPVGGCKQECKQQ